MSKKYSTKVNSNFNFEVDKDALSKLDISKLSTTEYHVLHNNQSLNITVSEADFNSKTYTVIINNNTYKVDIATSLDVLIKEMGFELGTSKQINEIKAPMPGLILDITVKIGQEVKEDESLLILEAMKMENNLTAPRDGVIKSISVEKGDAVEKNQLLIEFE